MAACSTCGFESQETFKFCPECGAESTGAAPSREQRKTVTVLFCDLTGSTALGETLDPERLRALLARYFDEMKAIVERHGGSVEKFIGDAVMAVFGVPVVHEDDALRAVRAAVEMRDALPGLGLQGRIGVTTGEVVTGTAERLVTGDAVNVASRLEHAAQPGSVLIGQPTLTLVHDAIEFEAVEPLSLKGKSEPIPAYRLLRVLETPERSHDALFVGRERELALLLDAWKRVQTASGCELVTIIGDAGVGKSRLIAEFLGSIEATVVRGRCLPYGESITYWPVVEVLKQLTVLPPNEAVLAAIRSLLGESNEATSAEEIAWAFRKTLEHVAADRPLVVVFDDIQWGEETFRDLIEHVALLSAGAAILLICMARSELRERRPDWPVAFRLEPLNADDVDKLIPAEIDIELRERVARAAGGNPLFIGEMLAMAGDAQGAVIVPPTLQALLAARLDQLEATERGVLERGSIEGEIFHRGAVQALSPPKTQVTPRLAALVRKELIKPDRAQYADDDGFRFRHLLLRDAAYDALPKATRADLHELFATWLEEHGAGLVEFDEVIGYHLEQACRYSVELGGPADLALAVAARRHLTVGGRRAKLRSDHSAAVGLLERAASLLPATEIDLSLEIDLGDSLYEIGKGREALQRADALAERASIAGDHVSEQCAKIRAAMLRGFLDAEDVSGQLSSLLGQALPEFQSAADDLALYIGYHALGWVAFTRARTDAALEAYERASIHARKAGRPDELLGWRAICRLYGTTPLSQLLTWLDENEPLHRRDHWLRATRALALALLGHIDEARAILRETRAELGELGGGIQLAVLTGIESATIELLAGDPAAAAELGAEGCGLLEELGDVAFLSSAAATLARSLYALDRLDEADVWSGRAAELGASDDAFTQMSSKEIRAMVRARRGEHVEAERLAREALAIGETTHWLDGQGDAHADLAEVLVLGGKHGEATVALELALACFKRKGNVVSAARVEARLTALASLP